MTTDYHTDVAFMPHGSGTRSARFIVFGPYQWYGPTRIDGEANDGVKHEVTGCIRVQRNVDFGLELEFARSITVQRVTFTEDPGGATGDVPVRDGVATFVCRIEHEDKNYTFHWSETACDGRAPDPGDGVSITVRVRPGTVPVPESKQGADVDAHARPADRDDPTAGSAAPPYHKSAR